MPSERDIRQVMIDHIGARSVPRDELVEAAAAANDGTAGTATRIAERLLGRDMAFAEIGGDVCYVPALAEGTTWTVQVDADDVERGFVRMHPSLSAVGWWLITSGADLVSGDGEVLGRITTDGAWIGDTEPDVDVVIGPPGWLDAATDGWMALRVHSEQLHVARCGGPPIPTARQIAAIRTGFERSIESRDAVLFDGARAELTSGSSDQTVLAALLADREAFVEAPVPFLPDLFDAAGLEERNRVIAEAGFDWDALEERRRRNRMHAYYGLDEREIDALLLLVGAFELHAERGDTALGATDDERDGAAILMSALLELDDVAESFWVEALSRGATAERVESFVDALWSRLADVEPSAVGWIKSQCLAVRGDVRGSVELVERLAGPDCDFGPLLIEAAAIASDRGDARTAVRLMARAGVTEDDLYAAVTENGDFRGDLDQAVLLLEEVLPYALRRPKARAGRNEPCPCGSGRKYKACHLGNERHELGDRSAWLYDKAARYVRTNGDGLVLDLADELSGGSFPIGRELAMSPLVIDLALHEEGQLAEFLDARGWLLPDDEPILAAQWMLVDRGVFEIVEAHDDVLTLRDIGRGETITVTNTHASDSTRRGMHLIGRPLPVGDTHRAFSGFLTVPHQLVNPLIDAIGEGDTAEMISLLSSMFRPPTLRNTSGEELVFHKITWSVDDPDDLPSALHSAGFTAGDDGDWALTEDTPGMRAAIITSLHFDEEAGLLVAETNSDERAAQVTDLVAAAVPAARLVDDERSELDEVRDAYGDLDDLDGDARDGPDPDDPEVRLALDEFVRAKEIEWLDQKIPALGGRSPREAVADPVGREEVRQLLASLPELPPGEVGGFRASRLRTHLDLDT